MRAVTRGGAAARTRFNCPTARSARSAYGVPPAAKSTRSPAGVPSRSTSCRRNGKRSCPARARGFWVQTRLGAPRLLTNRLENLDFIHGDRVVWTDYRRHRGGGLTFRVRLSSAAGRVVTIDHFNAADCDLGFDFGGPVYDHGFLYWTKECSSSVFGGFQQFNRARIETPRCASIKNDLVASDEPDFAVDGGQVFYSTGSSILQVAPKASWPAPHCRKT